MNLVRYFKNCFVSASAYSGVVDKPINVPTRGRRIAWETSDFRTVAGVRMTIGLRRFVNV